MSELKVDKITPRQGTTLTLGDSGDTINFGSGVLPNFENLTVTGDFTVDTNSLKVDSTNNRVGIGTTSPSVALDVVGAITASGTITANSFSGDGSSLTGITSTTINNNANNRLITGSDTANTLEGEANLTFDGTNLDMGDDKKIRLGASQDLEIFHDGSNSIIKDAGTGQLQLHADNFKIMNAAGDENIFFGAEDGTARLFHNNVTKLETTSTGVDVTGTIEFGDGHQLGNETTYDNLVVKSSTDENMVLSMGGTGQLIVKTGSTTLDNGSERFRITNSGNVGIGTTSPSAPIDVVTNSTVYAGEFTQQNTSNGDGVLIQVGSTASADYVLTCRSNDGAVSALAVKADGKVGIGTFSPSHTLDISDTSTTAKTLRVGQSSGTSNADATVIISNGGSGDAMLRFDYEGSDTDRARIGVTSSGQILRFYTAGNNERMQIDNSGNVGIGTSSPSVKLEVNGTIRTAVGSASSPALAVGDADTGIYDGGTNILAFTTGGTHRMNINGSGHLVPATTNTYDLGSSSLVWRDIYTSDFHMTNEGLDKGNDIDGTKGSWTFQEGEENLYLINNKNGKKYKFNLTEVT